MNSLYDTLRWRNVRARAIRRDDGRCTVSRLLGGLCSSEPLHVHHILAVSDGGSMFDLDNLGTTCAAHHPMWEALRRTLVERLMPAPRKPVRCRHRHQSAEGRRQCERRMARRQGVAA